MKNTLVFITFLLSFLAHSQDQVRKCSVKKELVEFADVHFKKLNEKGNLVVSEVLSYNELEKRGNGWNDFLKPNTFTIMRKLNINDKADQIDFTKFFSDEDFEYMKCQLKENTIDNWKQLMPKGVFYKADSVQKVIKKNNTLKKINASGNTNEILSARGKLRYYSIPLFDKAHNHAIVYQQSYGSGSLLIFKKQDNGWVSFALLLIWIQ